MQVVIEAKKQDNGGEKGADPLLMFSEEYVALQILDANV